MMTATPATVNSIRCPDCGKVGSSPRPIPIGTRVRCKCGTAFQAGEDTYATDEPTDPVAVPFAVPMSPVVATTPQPVVPVSHQSREPWYFPALVGIGWTVLALGAAQLIVNGLRYVVYIVETKTTAPMFEFGESALRWILAGSFGVGLASATLGLLIFAVVDIARSCRTSAKS